MNNENKIITYINSKDLDGNLIRHELHEHKNWQNIPYWFLVDAYLDEHGRRICETLRGFENYRSIEDGLDALEVVAGKKFTKEFRAMILNPDKPINQITA